MTEPMSDAERLAALLDGQLSERQRTELLERLALSEEDLAVLAHAGAVTRELEEEDRAAAAGAAAAERDDGVTALPPRRRPPSHGYKWMPVAAVLAGLALAGTAVLTRLGEVAASPVAPVEHLAAAERPLPAGFELAPWDAARGPGERLTGFARGVQLGAALTDLQLAARRRDAELRGYALAVAELLHQVPGTARAARFYRELVPEQGPPEAVDEKRLAAEARRVGELAGKDTVALGAWAQAARVAAATRDAAFFAGTRRDLDRLSGVGGVPPGAADALTAIRADLRGEGPPDWPRLASHLDLLLRTAAK